VSGNDTHNGKSSENPLGLLENGNDIHRVSSVVSGKHAELFAFLRLFNFLAKQISLEKILCISFNLHVIIAKILFMTILCDEKIFHSLTMDFVS